MRLIYILCITVESGTNWLTPELLSLFLFSEIRILNKNEELQIIKALVNN